MQSFRHFVAVGVGAAICFSQQRFAIALNFIEPGASKDVPSVTPLKSDPVENRDAQAIVIPNPEGLTASPNTPLKIQSLAPTANNQATASDQPIVNQVKSAQETFSSTQTQGLPTQNFSVSQPIQPASGTNIAQSPAPIPPQQFQKKPETPAPEYLNPSANPLLFPTKAEEVQIRNNQPITLQQALELGRKNNRDLEAAQLTLERNQFVLQEALAAEFPSATVNLDFSRTDSASGRISNAARANTPLSQLLNSNTVSTTFNGTLQLSYDLYTAGSRPASIRAAEKQLRFQELEVERISQQLRLNITRAYYNLQEADAQVEISQAAVTDAAQSLRDAQLQEQAGLGTQFDVLQAQVQLANANQDLTRAISQQRISRRQMVQLLSLAQPVDISAADPIEVAGNWELSLEQSIVLAFKNRAELEQQLLQRDISEQRRRIALAAVRPQAALTASYNILGVLDDNLGPAQGLALGARLQWNFFDGGAARARAKQETASIAIAESTFASQRNQFRFDVEQAFFTLNANRENIQTASFALERAQESLRLARLRFQAGVGTQTDVINQQTALTTARGNRLRAILDYNRALADLQRAISNLPNSNLFALPQ